MKASTPSAPEMEETTARRRRKREFLWMAIIIVLMVALYLVERHALPTKDVYPFSHNLVFFGLINLNLILICILIFLVLRNLAKLLFERRRNVLGSRLRTKLVIAFSAFALVPTAAMFYAAMSFVTSSIDNWFSVQIETSLDESLEVAKSYYSTYQKSSKFFAKSLATYAKEMAPAICDSKEADEEQKDPQIAAFFTAKQSEYNLGAVEIYCGKPYRRAYKSPGSLPKTARDDFGKAFLERAFHGETVSDIFTLSSGELIRGVAPVFVNGRAASVVVVSYTIPNRILKKMSFIRKTYEDYRQLMLFKTPILSSYIVVFALISIFIFFSATWFGFFLARGIAVPIQKMAEATERVAAGDLDARIEWDAKDEMGRLINSFNHMIGDLKSSREQLEQRRQYMETVLSNISTGVISFSSEGRISTINQSALQILGLDQSVVGRHYQEVFDPLLSPEQSKGLRRGLGGGGEQTGVMEREIEIAIGNERRTVLMRLTVLPSSRMGEDIYAVMVLDDLTELIEAKRMGAWREIAQRIAHEIKNPLTPIQLAAQRLRRRYGERFDPETDPAFFESTATIIRQVAEMKHMVQEFSDFARLAEVLLQPNQINDIIAETVVLYSEAHAHIHFDFEPQADLPQLQIDRAQIKRVFINLLDNAVDAVSGRGRVSIRTAVDGDGKKITVHIADNGVGLPDGYRRRFFEPYFSTKKMGTGLGLSIVHRIMTDHAGGIVLKDNKPKGTVVVLSFPITLPATTSRDQRDPAPTDLREL